MKLAAVGSNCIDFYSNVDGGKAVPGGGPVNMAVYTVRLDGQAAYIGPVGNDAYGQVMVEAMKEKGVEISHLRIEEGKTAVSQVELIDGERIFGDYEEGVLENYVLTEEDLSFIEQFDVAICDVWGKVEGQFSQIQKRGVLTAFDCATKIEEEKELCERVMPYTDYLFFSVDEGDTDKIREKMKEIHKKGSKMVICMMGEEGSMCYDGKEFHRFGIIPCEQLVDTMGAGDSYIAGFLTGIIDGVSIEEAMEMGARNATRTLGYFGAW